MFFSLPYFDIPVNLAIKQTGDLSDFVPNISIHERSINNFLKRFNCPSSVRILSSSFPLDDWLSSSK